MMFAPQYWAKQSSSRRSKSLWLPGGLRCVTTSRPTHDGTSKGFFKVSLSLISPPLIEIVPSPLLLPCFDETMISSLCNVLHYWLQVFSVQKSLLIYKYINVCVCLCVHFFLGHFETDWYTLWHKVSFYPWGSFNTKIYLIGALIN